ncbi:LysM peptidoglycan-binding domain-containing protein [Paenibacillus sp. MSJ-34]|nr:LysM peptidoglycan-binding domain-containing protein [Paenibacillus sp. MSJ-34]
MMSLGEVDFAQGEKVKEITFSSFFPKEYDSSYCRYRDIPDPQVAMNQLNVMLNSKRPLRLIITDTAVNVLVFVSAHNSTFKGGEPGDVYFDITCRTWRNVKVRTSQASSASGGGQTAAADNSRPDLKKTPKTYVVKAGDSLSKIAKQQLKSSSRWKEIYNLNKKVIGPDPNKLKPGQKLVMP